MPVKRRTPDGQALAELARRQHGVVAVRQMLELGYARATIGDWERAGRLHRLHRGVYAVGHEALSWEGRLVAAVLANEPAVASHVTAAWIHGLLRKRPGTFHLAAPSRRHRKELVVVHFARLEPDDVMTVNGIPLTSPARTVLDLAPGESPRDLGRLLRRADDNELLDRRRFMGLLARAGGHPGRAKLAAALASYRPETVVLPSDLERRFLERVIAAGLPRPQTNVVVEGYELDCYWEAEGFAVELETYATHGSPTSFVEDPKRHDDLLLAGIELIRVSDVRLDREPRQTIARLADHLARRRATIWPRRSVA